MWRAPSVGRAVLVVVIALALSACSGERTSKPTVPVLRSESSTSLIPSTAAPSSSSTSAATTVASTTPATLDAVEEDLVGIRDGAFTAAWNRGDLEELWSFFAEDASFDGAPIGSAELAARVAFWQAIGWRIARTNCEWANPRYAECKTTYRDDIHAAAGLEFPGQDQFWFDDSGLITAFSPSAFGSPEIYRFDEDFEQWLTATYPGIAAGYFAPEPDAAAGRAAVAVVPEFLAWSEYFPVGDAPAIPDPVQTGIVNGVSVYNANADQQALVEWAIGRFADAGLPPPPVARATFPPTEACATGVRGMAFFGGGRGGIDVCAEPGDFTGDADLSLPLRTTILHELSHLWTAEFVDAATQQEFLDVRGLEQWSGDIPWEAKGTEQAAEVLTWALLDEPVMWRLRDVPLFPRIPHATCMGLAEAYETLTGALPTQRVADCVDVP